MSQARGKMCRLLLYIIRRLSPWYAAIEGFDTGWMKGEVVVDMKLPTLQKLCEGYIHRWFNGDLMDN